MLCVTICLWGQQSVIDSLNNALESAQTDSERVTLLVSLAKMSADAKEALSYSRRAVDLSTNAKEQSLAWNQVAWSQKNLFAFDSAMTSVKRALGYAREANDAMLASDAFNTYGSIHNNQGNFDSALYYHKRSLNERETTDDLEAQAISMNNISIVLERLGRYDSASYYIDRSMAIYEQLGYPRRIADSHLNKGNLLTNAGDLDAAYESFQSALRSYESLDLEVMMTYALINMGTVALELGKNEDALAGLKRSEAILMNGDQNARLLAFTHNTMGQAYQALALPDSAIVAYLKGAEAAEQAQSKYLVSFSYNNLGQLYEAAGDEQKAIQYLTDALALKAEIGDESGLSSVYVALGRVYTGQGLYAKAEEHLKTGREKAEATGDMSEKEAAYEASYALARKRGNYKAALEYYEKRSEVKDSLLNAEHLNRVAELNTEYDTEKKQQQLDLQEAQLGQQDAQLERNRILNTGLAIAALLLIVIVGLVKARANKEQALLKREADLRLREAEINAVINSQEKERNRFAKDLHDGFGQMISVLKLNLGRLGNGAGKKPETQLEVFEQSEKVIEEMYAELRNICFDLMPQTLVKHGLPSALKEFGQRVSAGSRVLEVMVFDVEERLPELVEVSLYRISQEWVNNILKHSNADHITLQLTTDATELTLTIEDNGMGFEPNTFYEGSGNGWRNIQSRLNLIKGSFDLDSRPGHQGSLVSINVPMAAVADIPTGTEQQIRA